MRAIVRPVARVRGTIAVPGDKSIAHRALMLAAISDGECAIEGVPEAGDVGSTARVLAQLGVRLHRGEPVRVEGAGLRGLQAPAGVLDCGNSGTTLRLLAGLLAGQRFGATLTGDASLRRRPMARIVEPLRAMGARVRCERDDRPPVTIAGGPLRGVTYRSPVASAQVKSCVLLAGLYADGPTRVIEPYATRDHTERLLDHLGVPVCVGPAGPDDAAGRAVEVRPVNRLRPLRGRVPGDLSSAAYWMALAAASPDADLCLQGVGLNPTRLAVVELLREWGAAIEIRPLGESLGEPYGDLRVRSAGVLAGGSIAGASVPALIDELPLLAALGPLTREGVEIRDAAELRVKESDRIATTCAALRALGVRVDERPDGLAVAGGQRPAAGRIRAAGDHRIALAFAVLAALAGGAEIDGAEACAVSYPGFFEQLGGLAVR